ncbi:unnamed protein product [Closterium sp. Naga37s-1]|nr:unnamed protein product [Closterium sp. Naga37s-1]
MAALKREMDEMRRAMAKGALDMMGAAGGNHGAGSAAAGKAGEDVDGLPAQAPPKGEALMALVEAMIAARVKDVRDEVESQVQGLKEQLEAARGEARDAASEARAVIARQATEIADVRATAAHIDARMNDVELAVAEWKVARETPRAERSDGSDGSDGSAKERAEAEEAREGKKRKREVAGKGDELSEFAGAADDDTAADEKRDEAEEEDTVVEVEWQEVKGWLFAVGSRVAKLETTSDEGRRIWEAMLTLWAAAVPGQTRMDLSGISCLTDTALTHLTSLHYLKSVNLKGSSGFTAAGMRKLYSLAGLVRLELGSSATADADLEGIACLKNLRSLAVSNTDISDVGVARLQELRGREVVQRALLRLVANWWRGARWRPSPGLALALATVVGAGAGAGDRRRGWRWCWRPS